jgi:type I restriction enzyme S subunit
MLDLAPGQLEIVRDILAALAPECEALAFGSRVRGDAVPASDLDVALRGASRLGVARFAALREAFEESPLPFRVDLVDWHDASPEFRAVIDERNEPIRVPG